MTKPQLYDLIVANECRNTHHKLVMNALQHLKCPDSDKWVDLFVRYFEVFLEGSKDPDTKFKDFRNHVLHVSENYWGGPVSQAEKWYETTVEDLKAQNWRSAVYSAGVSSHYYMDPLMPLHTGQTEEEGVIHRACEWSVNKSFKQLIELLETTTGYPEVSIPEGNGWLKSAIHQGAEMAHQHYRDYIDHYNFEAGRKNPPAGLDDHLRKITAQLLGYASVGYARILERAFAEAGAIPAKTSSTGFSWFYRLTAPVSWGFKGLVRLGNFARLRKIASEYKRTGKVVQALPKDEKQVRQQHATEVLIVDIEELNQKPISPVGSKHVASEKTTPSRNSRTRTKRKPSAPPRKSRKKTPKFRLETSDPVVDAPSIGPKTAARLQAFGIATVEDFLNADASELARDLQTKHINEDTIKTWQTQSQLACQIPGIAGHDAQIMVACGFESPDEVANADPETILSLVGEFEKTREAKFIIRNGNPPDMEEVQDWIAWSSQSRKLKAG